MYRAHPPSCKTTYINARKIYHTKSTNTNGLPDDEHMMFETYRKQEEQDYNRIITLNLKSVHFVGLHYIIIATDSIKNNVTTFLPLKKKPQISNDIK
jgi:hypothetical protein